MKSIAVANQKGGVGKTTVATHLGRYNSDAGKSVLFIDLDPQGNASSTLAQHAVKGLTTSQLFAGEIPSSIEATKGRISLIASDKRLYDLDKEHTSVLTTFVKSVNALAEPFDMVVVDVGPSMGNRMAAALLACDALLCPIEPEKYAIDGVAAMIQTHKQMSVLKAKAGLPCVFLGVLLTKVNRAYPRHRATAAELLEKHGNLILPVWLPARSAIGEAQNAGVMVWELGTSSSREAAKEMREVCEFLTDKMAAQ